MRSCRRDRRDAADHAHRRRLARAVWSEEAEGLSPLHVEVDPVDGDEGPEVFDQSPRMNERQLCRCIHHLANYRP